MHEQSEDKSRDECQAQCDVGGNAGLGEAEEHIRSRHSDRALREIDDAGALVDKHDAKAEYGVDVTGAKTENRKQNEVMHGSPPVARSPSGSPGQGEERPNHRPGCVRPGNLPRLGAYWTRVRAPTLP